MFESHHEGADKIKACCQYCSVRQLGRSISSHLRKLSSAFVERWKFFLTGQDYAKITSCQSPRSLEFITRLSGFVSRFPLVSCVELGSASLLTVYGHDQLRDRIKRKNRSYANTQRRLTGKTYQLTFENNQNGNKYNKYKTNSQILKPNAILHDRMLKPSQTVLTRAFNPSTQVDLWIGGQPGLQNEIQNSKDCREKPCLEKENKYL